MTLFGLVLATGLVVDDAIIVVENIARFIQEKKMKPYDAAVEGMKEIFGAVLATSLVLITVFVPVAFFPGTTGKLYKQFACLRYLYPGYVCNSFEKQASENHKNI